MTRQSKVRAAALRLALYLLFLLLLFLGHEVSVQPGRALGPVLGRVGEAALRCLAGGLLLLPVLFLLQLLLPAWRGMDRRLAAYQRQRFYWFDWAMCRMGELAILCGGGSAYAAFGAPRPQLFPLLLLFTLLTALTRHALRRAGPCGHYPYRRAARAALRGRAAFDTCRTVILYNTTAQPLSSFSNWSANRENRGICAFDWARDVSGCVYRTPEGERALQRSAELVVRIVSAQGAQQARQALIGLAPLLRQDAREHPAARLAVVFLTPEPCELTPPPELGYFAQLTVKAVPGVEQLPLAELVEQRLCHTGASASLVLALLEDSAARGRAGRPSAWLRQQCESAYWELPSALVAALTPQGTPQPGDWPAPVGEFFRGAMQLPCLTSILALLDLMDLQLRLGLYTALAGHGQALCTRENIPSDFAALWERLRCAVTPGDALWESLAHRRVPCRFPALLRQLEVLLDISLSGDSYSAGGLCYLLRYIRNKARGHGSIQKDIQGVLWVLLAEAALALGQFLQLERLTLRCEEDGRLLAGWDGAEHPLAPLAFSRGGHPVLAFDATKLPSAPGGDATGVFFIDYFDGDLITPSFPL